MRTPRINATRLALFLTLGLTLALGAVVAQDTDCDWSGRGPCGSGGRMERMVQRLGLDAEQEAAVKAAFETHHQSMDSERELMHQARETLNLAIQADAFDETAIRDAAAHVAALEANRAVERARFRQELRQILTPEQMDDLDEMVARRFERRGRGFDDSRGRGRGRGRGGRGPHGYGGGF